ncbi:MAG: glycosyltransferase family 4 protein [Sphingobacteriaceae bacterium]|nr:glycosyltransferase family 4 protein [Sphingobacteriaceae bacterium]
MKKILFIDNTAHHLLGQLHLMTAFRNNGYIVEVIVPNDKKYYLELENSGIVCHEIQIDGKGLNPFKDYSLIQNFKSLFLQLKPDLICSFTIKPNLYASIAARQFNIPVIAGITGLGTAFLKQNLLNYLVVKLYKFAFKQIGCVFFQNQDDKLAFESLSITEHAKYAITLPGDGVDLKKFSYVGLVDSPVTTFIFSGRLLLDKGLGELVAAMKIVKQKYPNTKLIVIGNYFFANPSSISSEQMQEWTNAGLIEYLGMVNNVFDIISGADCMILPSYREGMPRSLLEAMSMGKPIITVNSIGCKDVVEDGVTGYMAKVKDVDSLADAMTKFIELSFDEKLEMGLNGRRKMEQEFDQQIVINKYLDVANQLLHAKE